MATAKKINDTIIAVAARGKETLAELVDDVRAKLADVDVETVKAHVAKLERAGRLWRVELTRKPKAPKKAKKAPKKKAKAKPKAPKKAKKKAKAKPKTPKKAKKKAKPKKKATPKKRAKRTTKKKKGK